VDLEVRPAPSEGERAAIEAAVSLLVLREDGVDPRGSWWQTGVRDLTADEAEEEPGPRESGHGAPP
jgi:hypothetical protein